MRIAIVSSPRSGNSWVRIVLAGALGLPEIAAHNYLDFPTDLPASCVVQIHWYREPNFQRWLVKEGFTVITIARHPLDLLLSALHFVKTEPETARWLEGNTGLQDIQVDTTPSGPAFLNYALGFGAENLFSVTYQWWHEPESIKLRYENILRYPQETFGKLVGRFGGDTGLVRTWLNETRLEVMQARTNRHGWQGKAGLWRHLIPPRDSWLIFRRHRQVFKMLGYDWTPYLLSRRAAGRNWLALA